MSVVKRPTNDTLNATASGMVHNDSFRSNQDIFSTENSEQAKDMIINNIRQELYRTQSRTTIESNSEDYNINKIDSVDVAAKAALLRINQNAQKSTMLLAGPNFRYRTSEPSMQLMRDTIYPVSVTNIYLILD